MITILGRVELGVQSYCYREFSNEMVIAEVKKLGMGCVELSRRHLMDVTGDGATNVVSQYRDANVRLSSYGILPLERIAHPSEIEPLFTFAQRAGISTLGARPDASALPILERLSEQYGVRIAIHNHGRDDDLYGSWDQLQQVLNHTSDRVGLCLDTGWMIDVGEDLVHVIESVGSRIYGIHFKDFGYTNEGAREETILGLGRLNLIAVMKALKGNGFRGWASIEYEAAPKNPTPSILQCIEALVSADPG